MSSAPLDTPFTIRELEISRQAAGLLWIASGLLLGVLVLWSTGPHGLI
jgi:hypothetical protein